MQSNGLIVGGSYNDIRSRIGKFCLPRVRYDMPPGAPWRNGKCADYLYGSHVVHPCRVKVLWQTQYPILPSLAYSFGADPTCTLQESQPRLRIMSCDPLLNMKRFKCPCQ